MAIVIEDSVTALTPANQGDVAYCASHGGTYAAYLAVRAGLAAVILNDAGIGREQAGIAGIFALEACNMPAAAVSAWSARIGVGRDGPDAGVLSTVNRPAQRLGLFAGQRCADALALLLDAACVPQRLSTPFEQAPREARFRLDGAVDGNGRGIAIIGVDSIALSRPEDAGQVLITGSHGGLLGGQPDRVLAAECLAVVTNDAGRGRDAAGVSRLPVLEARGIAGATVSAFSARIGEARSTWEQGYISAINGIAAHRGGRIGQSCHDFTAAILAHRGD